MSTAPNPTNVFHNFSTLPAELRVMIWKNASFQPRIVHVRSVQVIRANRLAIDGEDKYQSGKYEHTFVSNNTVPAVLHACQESRAEALKWYTLDLSGYWTQKKPTIYFNHAVDTIYFETEDICEQPGPMSFLWSEGDDERNAPAFLFSSDDETDDEKAEEDVEGGTSVPGNKNAEIERLAINLQAFCQGSNFWFYDFVDDAEILPCFDNLQELTLFHETDSSIRDKRGDIISSELDKELKLVVGKKERTNAKLLAILEGIVEETYEEWAKETKRREEDCKPPKVRIMKITRLP